MSHVRYFFAVLALFLVGFAFVSLATGFVDDARKAGLAAAAFGFVWLLFAVWDECRRQNNILAEHMRPDPYLDALNDDVDDELPWLIRGDSTAPLRTETIHAPTPAVQLIDGDKRPWWDPEIWGAVE